MVSVTNKFFMLSVIMLDVVMPSVMVPLRDKCWINLKIQTSLNFLGNMTKSRGHIDNTLFS